MAQSVQDISRRLLIESAFLNYGCLRRVSDAEVDKLYAEIEKLNADPFKDDQTFEKVTQYKLESLKSKEELKERIHQMRAETANRALKIVAENANAEQIAGVLVDIGVSQKMAKRYAEVILAKNLHQELSPEDESLAIKSGAKTIGRRNKNKETEKTIWADQLANNLFDKIDILKKRTFTDLQTYQDAGFQNVLIEERMDDIKANLTGMKITLNYTIKPQNKEFSDQLRADCNKEGGVKENFYKLIGLLAENGKNAINSPSSSSNYQKFEAHMTKIYGKENVEAALDKALGKKEERQSKYAEKSKELYVKLMCSLLAKKYAFDRENHNSGVNYQDYARSLEQHFIKGLARGVNNVSALGFTEPDANNQALSFKEERKRAMEIRSAANEEKSASYHHKLPIGSGYDVTDRLFGKLDAVEKLAEASALINNIGNGCLVVGKDKHESLEAKGSYVLTANADNMIFASRYDASALQNALRSMPAEFQKAAAQYVRPNQTDLSVGLNLGEHAQMTALRQTLKTEEKSNTLTQIYSRLYPLEK